MIKMSLRSFLLVQFSGKIKDVFLISVLIVIFMVNQSYALTFNITRVTNNDRYDEFYPSLSNDKIAWIRGHGDGLQVFTWDGNSTAQLTADSLFRKDISIHNGKISYVAEEVLSGNVLANYLHYYDGTIII